MPAKTDEQKQEIARDERQERLTASNADQAVQIAVIANNISHMAQDIVEIKAIFVNMKNFYVTLDEFKPVRMIVYGMVGVVLLAVLGALVALVTSR